MLCFWKSQPSDRQILVNLQNYMKIRLYIYNDMQITCFSINYDNDLYIHAYIFVCRYHYIKSGLNGVTKKSLVLIIFSLI